MRFIFGVIVGIALALAGALFHDDNLPRNPQSVADQPVVNWEVLAAITRQGTDTLGGWWDRLMGRDRNLPPPLFPPRQP